MTALQILGLILFIVALAGVLGFLFQAGKDTDDQEPYIKPAYTKEELENIKLAEELYNKDLRPVVVKQAAPSIAKDIEPVVAEELNVTEPEFVPAGLSSKPVSPEFPNVGKDLTKVFPTDAAINTEAVVEKVKETKSEFPIDKPKKKRKPRTKAKK